MHSYAQGNNRNNEMAALQFSSPHSESALPLFKRFIDTYMGQTANNKLFKALEVAVNACPEVIRGGETIFCVLTKAVSRIESQRKLGTDDELRYVVTCVHVHECVCVCVWSGFACKT